MGKRDESPRPLLAKKIEQIGSFRKAAARLAETGVSVSASFLNLLVRGEREPSAPMSRGIARGLGLRLEDVVGR